MTRAEKIAEAQRLRAGGLTLQQIADRLGYRHAESATRLLRDPSVQAEMTRRDNAKRNAAKRAWEREHDRAVCPCGAAMGVGAARKGATVCRECHVEQVALGRAMRCERIADMWAQGCTLREIAEALDSAVHSIGASMSRMRAAGWDLPYRHNWSAEGLARARNSRRAA